MFNTLTDYFFWFAQPSTILDQADKYFLFFFIGLLGLGVVLGLVTRFAKNSVNKALFRRFFHLAVWTAIGGLVWFGIRYENTPIFARRYWAGITLLVGVVWLLFILKYLVFNFRHQKTEYDKEQIKKKYLPKTR